MKIPRAPSAYNLFTKAIRPQIVDAAPEGTTSTEIMKLIGAKWSSISEEEKRPYQEQAKMMKLKLNSGKATPNKKSKKKKKASKDDSESSSSSSSSSEDDTSSSDEDSVVKNEPIRIPKSAFADDQVNLSNCLLYTSPSPRDS